MSKNTIVNKYNSDCIALKATVIVLFLSGCPVKPPDLCEDDETTCTMGASTYGCINFWGVEIASCQTSLPAAHAWCAEKGGGSSAAYEINCFGVAEEGTGGESDWDGYVTNPSAGVYNIDPDLVGLITADFTILETDSTVLVDSGLDDYFMLSGVASGDLADVLGLQTGDILLSVNSESLNGTEDAIEAFETVENDTTLVLLYKRSGTNHTHYYIITE